MGQPELEVVLLASREQIDEDIEKKLLSAIKACSDSALLARHSFLNMTFPLVLNTLNQPRLRDSSDFALSARGGLERLWRGHSRHRRRIARAHAWIAREFSQNSIPYAVLRGMPFAQRFWRRPHLRLSSDLDLLVPEKALQRAEEFLLDSGFSYLEEDAKRMCRGQYMGQVELYHRQARTALDLNWRMTGNAGIGSIDAEMDVLWQRATHIPRGEILLSQEDVLVDLIRHFCHGHDYGQCFLKTCVDAHAVLATSHDALDWEYIVRQAERCECLTGLRQFAWMYGQWYRQPHEPDFPGLFSPGHRLPHVKQRVFAASLCWPRIKLRARRNVPGRDLLFENLGVAAKIWALDSVRGLKRVLKVYFWPTPTELILLARKEVSFTPTRARFNHWVGMLLVLPGLLVGTLGFFVGGFRKGKLL